MAASPKKYNIDDISKIANPEITLKALADRNKISVSVKAIRVDDPVKVAGSLKKQDIAMADKTSAARLTL